MEDADEKSNSDMNNSNVHIAGLALSTLGNIASAEMARDLSFEVEKLLTSNVTHLRKKVPFCSNRHCPTITERMTLDRQPSVPCGS